MGATDYPWPSSGLPSGTTATSGITGTTSAHFPSSAYYPVADANAGSFPTDNAGYEISSTANDGAGGRITASCLFYNSNWSDLGTARLLVGGSTFYIDGSGGAVMFNGGVSGVAASQGGTGLPASGLVLLIVTNPVSPIDKSTLAVRRFDTGQWLQTDGSWNSTFAYVLSAVLGGGGVANAPVGVLIQQSGGSIQAGTLRWMVTGTPAVSPTSATVAGGATQAFDFSGFEGALVGWSETLGSTVEAQDGTATYTAPAATGSVQTGTVTVTGFGNTGQSAASTVTIPAGSAATGTGASLLMAAG